MKILVFLDHDIIIRHFVHSNAFSELVKKHEIYYVLPKENKRVQMKISEMKLCSKHFYADIPPRRLFLWRTLNHVDKLRFKFGKQYRNLRRFSRRVHGMKVAFLYSVLGIPIVFSLFKRYTLNSLKKHPFSDLDYLLEKEMPDIVIHPTVMEGIYVNDLIMKLKSTNIPLIMIMNSWDNPSTKKSMIGNPDWLLVWGQQTKNHAIKFSKINHERVKIFGAAQFDIHYSEKTISRGDFQKTYGLPDDIQIILYAGSSKMTSEIDHLISIDSFIEQNNLNIKVIYRPHPWGGGGKNGHNIIDMKWNHILIEKSMITYLRSLKADHSKMSYPSYQDTHNTLSNVDGVISPLSTIIIESAIHGLPVICFLPEEGKDSIHFMGDLNLTHFDEIFNSKRVLVKNGLDEMLNSIPKLIELPKENNFAKKQKQFSEFFVKRFNEPYPKRLNDFVDNLQK